MPILETHGKDNQQNAGLSPVSLFFMHGLDNFLVISQKRGKMNKGNSIGKRIRAKRVALGYSQEQLAERMCITAALLSNYENDKVDIKLSSLRELARHLNTTVGYLADGEPEIEEQMKELMNLYDRINVPSIKDVALKQLKILTEL